MPHPYAVVNKPASSSAPLQIEQGDSLLESKAEIKDKHPNLDKAKLLKKPALINVEYKCFEWQAKVLAVQMVGIDPKLLSKQTDILQQWLYKSQKTQEAREMDEISASLYCGALDMSQVLSLDDFNADQLTSGGLTLLHLAVLMGNNEWIDILTENAGANVNLSQVGRYETLKPLHLAVALSSMDDHIFKHKDSSVIETLLGQDADIDVTSLIKYSPLLIAAAYDCPKICALLIKRGATVTSQVFTNYIKDYGEKDSDLNYYLLKFCRYHQKKGVEGVDCIKKLTHVLASAHHGVKPTVEEQKRFVKLAQENDEAKDGPLYSQELPIQNPPLKCCAKEKVAAASSGAALNKSSQEPDLPLPPPHKRDLIKSNEKSPITCLIKSIDEHMMASVHRSITLLFSADGFDMATSSEVQIVESMSAAAIIKNDLS